MSWAQAPAWVSVPDEKEMWEPLLGDGNGGEGMLGSLSSWKCPTRAIR